MFAGLWSQVLYLFPAPDILYSGLFMMNTLMVREHNRVCGVLKKEHPEWGDEQLFQTAKNIIGGRCMSLRHSSRYNYVHCMLVIYG